MVIANIPSTHGGLTKLRPEMIIVHSMAEFIQVGDRAVPAHELLDNLGLSAHALATPGGVVIRTRTDEQLAFHAGVLNPKALGLEFLVPGVWTYKTFIERIKTPYLTPAQLRAGIELVKGWSSKFNIPMGKVKRHSTVAPGRKFDPGVGFPWSDFIAEVFLRDSMGGD